MTGRREQNKIQCREDILKASRRLFSSKGYNAAKMEDIAKKASVSKATLYNYFQSKESLLIGTVEEVYSEVQSSYEQSEASGIPADECLYQAFKILVLSSLKYPRLAQRITWLNADPESSLYQCLGPVVDLIRKLVDPLFAGTAGDSGHAADHAMETLLGIYYVALYHWSYTYPDDESQILERLHDIYWNAWIRYARR